MISVDLQSCSINRIDDLADRPIQGAKMVSEPATDGRVRKICLAKAERVVACKINEERVRVCV